MRIRDEELDVGPDQLFTWQGRPFTGCAFDTTPEGQLTGETEYVEGLQQGTCRVWHPNGQLAAESSFWHGVLHGRDLGWNTSGQLVCDAVYELGVLVRNARFDPDGAVAGIWTIDADDATLALHRGAYGASAPPVSIPKGPWSGK